MLEEVTLHAIPNKPRDPQRDTWIDMPRSLRDLDLNKELLDQYVAAKAFLKTLQGDPEYDQEGDGPDTPANQVAQVMNTVQSILASIIKLQESLYNVERIKSLEASIISALRLVPQEAQDAFLAEYEKLAK